MMTGLGGFRLLWRRWRLWIAMSFASVIVPYCGLMGQELRRVYLESVVKADIQEPNIYIRSRIFPDSVVKIKTLDVIRVDPVTGIATFLFQSSVIADELVVAISPGSCVEDLEGVLNRIDGVEVIVDSRLSGARNFLVRIVSELEIDSFEIVANELLDSRIAVSVEPNRLFSFPDIPEPKIVLSPFWNWPLAAPDSYWRFTWMGWVFEDWRNGRNPWFYHSELGWFYLFQTILSDRDRNRIWHLVYFNNGMGWVWFTPEDWPYMYSVDYDSILLYDVTNTSQRYFYVFELSQWVTL